MLNVLVVGWAVKDSETGLQVLPPRDRRAASCSSSENDGWFWDTEVLARALLADLRIHEMPVLFVRRWEKQSTVRLGRDIVNYLIGLHCFRARVGLSLLNKSPIYWNAAVYDFLMRLLFGKEHELTYVDVARQIPEGASVVDLCCGTGRLYRHHLRGRVSRYLGLDFNGHFLLSARRRGVPTRFFNVLSDPIPKADYVLMVSSLYHFRSRAGDVLERMKAAATRAAIVSEPVHNLSHRGTLFGRLAARLTNPGVGEYAERFDLAEMRTLASQYGATEFLHRESDRNAIIVFRGEGFDAEHEASLASAAAGATADAPARWADAPP